MSGLLGSHECSHDAIQCSFSPVSCAPELFLFSLPAYPMMCYGAVYLCEVAIHGEPSQNIFTFSNRLLAMCPDTSSRRGIVSPFLDSREFAVSRF